MTMIEISGQVGTDLTYDDFRKEMQGQSGDIELMINSPGGSVHEGIGIYNTIAEYSGKVTAYVNGIAASIASVIAMAADEVVVYQNSQMMIHKAWTVAIGNSDDFRSLVGVLDILDSDIARIYSEKTGKSEAAIIEAMSGETYYTAEQAVEFGLADSVKIVAKRKQRENAQMPETFSGLSVASVLARASVIRAKVQE